MGYDNSANGNKSVQDSRSVSVHVVFQSSSRAIKITDETLRNIFHPYGNLLDVSIKQSIINRDTHCQNGYAFVCFETDEKGILNALRAAKAMNNITVGGIYFESEISKILQQRFRNVANFTPPPQEVSPPVSYQSSPATHSIPYSPMISSMISPPLPPHQQLIPLPNVAMKSMIPPFPTIYPSQANFSPPTMYYYVSQPISPVTGPITTVSPNVSGIMLNRATTTVILLSSFYH
jgi:hypothetical protein